MRIGVLASGRGSNLQAILDAIEVGTLNAQVVGVISDRADAQALRRAALRKIPAIHLDPRGFADRKEMDREMARILRDLGAEWIALAGYLRILSSDFLQAFPGRVVNIHPSLLPAFPGLHAQRQAWEYGVQVTGCTVHLVDQGLDTGPILLQKVVPVLEGDDLESLTQRILVQEHIAYPEALEQLARGDFSWEGRRLVRKECQG